MELLKISDIRIDGGTQIRKELNQDKVDEYAQLMEEGVEFPPVVVFFDGSSKWLGGGYHRLFGEKKRGSSEIRADVRKGTLRDAIKFALGDNKHGLNMTAEDYRRAIKIALDDPDLGKLSNNKIAEIIGTSAMTVARVKKEANIKPAEEVTYTNKQGQEVKMKTANVGKKKPKEEPEEPKEVADEKAYDPTEDKLNELMHTITQLADENTLLRDKIAIGQWDASEIEKIDAEETIANLREQIRILEIDNQALRESRDMFQARNAELIKTVNSLKKKLQKGA